MELAYLAAVIISSAYCYYAYSVLSKDIVRMRKRIVALEETVDALIKALTKGR